LVAESKRRRAQGGGLYLCQLKEQVYEFLARGDFIEELGAENIFASKYDAMATIFERLDRKTCNGCPSRAFLECHILARRNLRDALTEANAEAAAA